MNSLWAVNIQGENAMANLFFTHCQYPHSDSPREMLPSPHPKVKPCCLSPGLRLWRPWHALLTQAFLCSLQRSSSILFSPGHSLLADALPSSFKPLCKCPHTHACLASLYCKWQEGQLALPFLPGYCPSLNQ